MDSDVNDRVETLETFDCDNLRLEDCQYILRTFERRAFEHVVCALRAQGPLSMYKQIILDHLKSLLFISEEDFLLRLRLCANDPILSKIAEMLNPSYDNSSEWMAVGDSLMCHDFPKIVQLNTDAPNKSVFSITEKMQCEMAKHNMHLDEEQLASLKLIRLEKRPYVPEKLRRLLLDTENDAQNRVDVLKEKTNAKAATTTHRNVGRPPRRFEKKVVVEPLLKRAKREDAARLVNARPSSTKSTHLKEKTLKAVSVVKPTVSSRSDTVKIVNKKDTVITEKNFASTKKFSQIVKENAALSNNEFLQATSTNDNSITLKRKNSFSKNQSQPSVVSTVKTSNNCVIGNNNVFEADVSKPADSQSFKAITVATSDETTSCAGGLSMQNVELTTTSITNFPPEKSSPSTSKSDIRQQQISAQKFAMKIEDTEDHKAHDEFSVHYSGGANVVVVDPEDQNTVKESKTKKRRSKLTDDGTFTCARVMPFEFEPAVSDLPKPPRGNPDKRCSRIKASKKAQTNNSDLNSFNYVPQQSVSGNYYSQKSVSYYKSAAGTGDILPMKRSRASSILDEPNFMYQKPVHSRVVGTPFSVLTTPSYGSASRSAYYGSSSTMASSPILIGSYPPLPSQSPQHSSLSQSLPSLSYVQQQQTTSNTSVRSQQQQLYMASHLMANNGSEMLITVGADITVNDAACSGEEHMILNSESKIIPASSSLTNSTCPRHNIADTVHYSFSGQSEYVKNEETVQDHMATSSLNQTTMMNDHGHASIYRTAKPTYYENMLSATTSFDALEDSAIQNPLIMSNSDDCLKTNGGAKNATSGLDFLASTASLLVPMQKQQQISEQLEPPPQQQKFYLNTAEQPRQTPLFAVSNDGSSSSYLGVVSSGSSQQNCQQEKQIIYLQNPASSSTHYSAAVAGQGNNSSEFSNITQQFEHPQTIVTYCNVEEVMQPRLQNSTTILGQSCSQLGPKTISTNTTTSENLILYLQQSQPQTQWIPQSKMEHTQSTIFDNRTASTTSEINQTVSTVFDSRLPQKTTLNLVAVSQLSSTEPQSTSTFSLLSSSASSPVIPISKTSQFSDNEAAQMFLKQHASLMDTNGVPLGEEITLGSIIRSSNLRNKLFNTAGKSSSASPNANSPSSAIASTSASISTLPLSKFSASTRHVLTTVAPSTFISTSSQMNRPTSAFSSSGMTSSVKSSASSSFTAIPSDEVESVNKIGRVVEDIRSVPYDMTRDFLVIVEGVAPPHQQPGQCELASASSAVPDTVDRVN